MDNIIERIRVNDLAQFISITHILNAIYLKEGMHPLRRKKFLVYLEMRLIEFTTTVIISFIIISLPLMYYTSEKINIARFP